MQSHRPHRRIAIVGCAGLSLAWANAGALAHAELRRAVPAADAIVLTAPVEVLVNFNEPLESRFSSVTVRNASGQRVDKSDAHVDPTDRSTLHVSLQPLAEGTYIVTWRAVTADTHRTEGSFTFRVERSK